MSKRTLGIVAVAALAAAGWLVFRPEKLVVNRKVSEDLPAGRIGHAPPVELARGKFHGVAHETKGSAVIYGLDDGRRTLRLAGFSTSNGPEVQIYLGEAADARDSETVTQSGFVSLGALKGNVGDQNYEIPASLDLSRYHSVTIWCHRFGVNFGTAPLRDAPLPVASK